MNRRDVLKAAAAVPVAHAGLAAFMSTSRAEASWPTRNITMIVPFPAGGQADLAGGTGTGSDEDICRGGKPGGVSRRAGVCEIRRGRQRPADRGGEEDRQGGVGRKRLTRFILLPLWEKVAPTKSATDEGALATELVAPPHPSSLREATLSHKGRGKNSAKLPWSSPARHVRCCRPPIFSQPFR